MDIGPEILGEIMDLQQVENTRNRNEIAHQVSAIGYSSSPELIKRIVALSEDDFQYVVRHHPGYFSDLLRTSFLRSKEIFDLSVSDLIEYIDEFENNFKNRGDAVYDSGDEAYVETTKLRVQKELFSVVNAAHSLVDHTRRLIDGMQVKGGEAAREQIFGQSGLNEFVLNIRNLLHHVRVVPAGYFTRISFQNQFRDAGFTISREAVSHAIDANPKKLSKLDRVRLFVDGSDKHIDLRELFSKYREMVRMFHAWLAHKLAEEPSPVLIDYDNLQVERKKYGTRLWWNAFLGNWLNWNTPPNPHEHLARFLTPDQMAAVYELPRNSQEQVDLVIKFADKDVAITDEIRAKLYELFRRSPSE